MKPRKVLVIKMVAHPVDGSDYKKAYVPESQGEALFLEFGVDYEELEGGTGSFTTAIIEWPDGRVESVPVHNIQFVVPLWVEMREECDPHT